VGLGLCLAREIVTLHGGTINAESTIGEGSAFTVLLPRLAEQEALLEPAKTIAEDS
jgi:signal transduction histidine kinase